MNDNRHSRIDDDVDEPKQKKKKKFNWFGMYDLDGKGVEKGEPTFLEHPTFGNFFRLFGRKWQKLISVNLLFVFGNFPIFFYFIYRAGYFGVESTAPYYLQFAPLYGAAMFRDNFAVSALYGIFGMQVPISANTPTTLVFFGLTALLLFTFGPVNAGVTHITRSMLRGDPVFLWHDFTHTIKKNWRQAIPMGIIDLGALFLLGYDVRYFWSNLTSVWMYVMFYVSLFMFVVFFMMRFYMYHIMITFDLSIFKILKNSLIFAILGIKRNLLALLGIIVLIALNLLLFGTYVPIGIILPFVIVPAIMLLIETYAAYPKIKEYMIDPYYPDDKSVEDGGEDADGGTESDTVSE